MSHLDDGLIQELLDGEVPSAALVKVQAHLESCRECATRLAEARDFAATSDEMIGWLDDGPAEPRLVPVAAPAIAVERRPARWPQNLAWAASLVLAAGLGYAARGTVAPTAPQPPIPIAAASDKAAIGRTTTATEPPRPTATAPRSPAREPGAVVPASRFGAEPAAERPMAGVAQKAADAEAGTEQDELAPARRERIEVAPVERQRNSLAAAGAAEAAAPQPVARAQADARAGESRATLDTVGTPVGMVFRIVGLELLRTALAGDELRLVYAHPNGEVTLVQRRVGSQVAWHLEVPAGFPATTLAELKGSVK